MAADGTDEMPDASMIALPRCPTVGMNVSLSQVSSLTSSFIGLPPDVAKRMSGYIVGEWLPQTISFSMLSAGLPVFLRQLGERAVVIEAQHRGEVLALEIRRALHGDVRVGVGRVAHHDHLHVTLGHFVQGAALRDEHGGVLLQQIAALHARATRRGADQQRDVDVLEGDLGVVGGGDALEQREGAVVELHQRALEALHGAEGDLACGVLDVGHFEQAQDDGLILAQHLAGGDPVEELRADAASGAGDCDFDGSFHGMGSLSLQ